MRILITGHLGYIGSTLWDMFERWPGVALMGADRTDGGDIRDGSTIGRIQAFKPDVILNCAGVSGKRKAAQEGPTAVREINTTAPRALRRGCPDALFVQFGTCSCFDAEWSEDLYATTKYQAESGLVTVDTRGGLVLLRLGTVYGPGKRYTRWDLPIHRMIKDGLVEGRISIPGVRLDRPWTRLVHVCEQVASIMGAHQNGFRFRALTAKPVPVVECNATLERAARLVSQSIEIRTKVKPDIVKREEKVDLRSFAVPALENDLKLSTIGHVVKKGMKIWTS